MITLKTSDLKTFIRYAAAVKPNILYPALDCIKAEADGKELTFTKTNNNVYCVAKFPTDQTFAPVLINERSVSGLLLVAEAEAVMLDGLVLKCGQRKVNIPAQDPSMYPNTPEPDPFIHDLPDAALEPIKIAARYYSRLPLINVSSYIHSDERGVFASNGHMTYYYKTEAPSLLLDEEVASVITSLKGVKYSTAGNYDWYFNDEVSYAFIRKECPAWPYERVLAKMEGDRFFACGLAELKKFCDLVQYTSKQENPLAVLSGAGSNLNLLHEDHDFGSGAEDNILMEANKDVAPFKFNVKTLQNILASLPYQQIKFTLCDKHYKITSAEDPNYMGILSALQN